MNADFKGKLRKVGQVKLGKKWDKKTWIRKAAFSESSTVPCVALLW
jgi:hypothetical protein